jgi:hypothetical protein
MRTIAEKPHYGKYVRALHWTVLDSYQNIVCRSTLLNTRPVHWRVVANVDGNVLRQSHFFEPFERHWRAFYGYVGKQGWDEAYESAVKEERENFPPEDGRSQNHVCGCIEY